MEDNSDLDSFLTNSIQGGSDAATNNVNTSQPQFKPKLRKIKRAKIRPAAPITPIPEKIMPTVSESILASIPEETINQPLEQSSDVNFKDEKAAHNDDEQQVTTSDNILTDASTELVTASEAQEMTSESYQDSYILEGLPPELDYNTDENYEAVYEGEMGYIKKSIFYAVSCACLVIGLFIGKTLFSSQTIENHGLEGVVTNPDVPQGRPRCGLTDKSQACIFYMMNWYKQELNGRDFYKLAAQLTGREEYMIETDNLRYATVKIRPGHFAQLNIPSLKE